MILFVLIDCTVSYSMISFSLQPAKREKPELKEDPADNKFLIMSPGFGNHILNFFNPEDEQKLRFSEISTQNTNYLKKKSNDYRLPKKRKGAVNSSRSRVPIFVNKGIGVGPVIEMVHSSSSFMHSNQRKLISNIEIPDNMF